MKEDQTMLKLTELSLDINQELESITCTKSTETFLSMEQSANFTWIWLVTTELQEILFQLLELLFSIKKMISEDQDLIYSEKTILSSPSLEQSQEQATKDTELSSKQPNQEHSDSDSFNLCQNDLFCP